MNEFDNNSLNGTKNTDGTVNADSVNAENTVNNADTEQNTTPDNKVFDVLGADEDTDESSGLDAAISEAENKNSASAESAFADTTAASGFAEQYNVNATANNYSSATYPSQDPGVNNAVNNTANTTADPNTRSFTPPVYTPTYTNAYTNTAQTASNGYQSGYQSGYQNSGTVPPVTPPPASNVPPTNGYTPYNSNMNNGSNPFEPPVRTQNAPKKKTGLRVFCVILAVTVLLSVGIGVGYIAGGNTDLKSNNDKNDLNGGGNSVVIQQGTVPTKDGITADENGKYSADEVAKLVSDSVVNITVYSESSSTSSIASGVILNDSGYIISNDHIYSEIPSAKFVITMNDGSSYPATYVAGDARSDLCVLKMSGADNLVAATFTDSSTVSSGEDVIAIGSPYGLKGTVTKGIVSSPSRRISFSSTINGTQMNYSMRVIQTDTALNSGNSGGALVNMYGQVVGISSSKIASSGYEGLCFAIPANDAIKIAKSLIQNKKVVGRARLGISYNEITAAAALVNDVPSGLMIQSVDIDSNLYSSGLSKGDIITEINGKTITAADIALDVIDDSTAGDKVTLKVYVSSSKSYKTMTAPLLEDTSYSSYSTEAPATTTGISPLW